MLVANSFNQDNVFNVEDIPPIGFTTLQKVYLECSMLISTFLPFFG